ncbi:hypothetical protein G9U53_26165 [Rhodococcus sp. D-46]|uniref:hypothetical protein n=1 Tax=Rhodococcus sp. D-46 TaxID=2716265 RepID=UPI0013F5A6CD|nr:hypothetical protein [Rhodococcus sp. D-46]
MILLTAEAVATATTIAPTPTWVLLSISAAGAALGAGVGGFATYKTARVTDKHKAQRDDQLALKAEIRALSVKFSATCTDLYMTTVDSQLNSTELNGQMAYIASVFEMMKDHQSGLIDAEEASKRASAFAQGPPENPMDGLLGKITALTETPKKIAPLTLIINELRLVAPNDLLDRASTASELLIRLVLNMEGPEKRKEIGKQYESASNDFTNAVRKYLDLPAYVIKSERTTRPV